MNNAQIQDAEWEEIPDLTPSLLEKQAVLQRLVEAIDKLSKNEDWQTLKQLLFDQQIERMEKQLLNEAKANELQPEKIYRLQGNLEWARRWDLYKLAETYKTELNGITKKLNENASIGTSR